MEYSAKDENLPATPLEFPEVAAGPPLMVHPMTACSESSYACKKSYCNANEPD